MSDLSERLYEAALNEIVYAPHDDHDVVDYEIAARGAASAVLQELANSLNEKPPREMIPAQVIRSVLRILADDIEEAQ